MWLEILSQRTRRPEERQSCHTHYTGDAKPHAKVKALYCSSSPCLASFLQKSGLGVGGRDVKNHSGLGQLKASLGPGTPHCPPPTRLLCPHPQGPAARTQACVNKATGKQAPLSVISSLSPAQPLGWNGSQEVGAGQAPPLFFFIFSPWSAPPPPGLELPRVTAPRQLEKGGGPILTTQVKAKSLIVCAGEAPSSLFSSLPAPSGWGRRCVYLVGGDGEGRWAAV